MTRARRMMSVGARAAAALGVAGAAIAGAPPAGAWSDGACPTADGVTVIIDFGDLGGGVHIRCAAGAPTSGFDALQRANIAYDTAIRQPGFVCRIAGQPASDPCIDTSPASAYWSYWIAPRGGSWCYSNLGAGARTPPNGTVEGWSFSMSRSASRSPAPRVAPPATVSGAPTALPASHCDTGSTAPTAAPSTAPATTAPPATAPTAPAPASAAPASQQPTPSTPATSGRVTTPGQPATSAAIGATGQPAAPGATVDAGVLSATTDVEAEVLPSTPDQTPAELPEALDTTSTTGEAPPEGDATDLAKGTVQLNPGDNSGSPVALVGVGGLLGISALVGTVMRKRAQQR